MSRQEQIPFSPGRLEKNLKKVFGSGPDNATAFLKEIRPTESQQLENTLSAYLIVQRYGGAVENLCRSAQTPFVRTVTLFETEASVTNGPVVNKAGRLNVYDLLTYAGCFPRWALQPALIGNVYVAEDLRNRGTATNLLKKAVGTPRRAPTYFFGNTTSDNIGMLTAATKANFTIDIPPNELRFFRTPRTDDLVADCNDSPYSYFNPLSSVGVLEVTSLPSLALRDFYHFTPYLNHKNFPTIDRSILDRYHEQVFFPDYLNFEGIRTKSHYLPMILEISGPLVDARYHRMMSKNNIMRETHEPLAYVVPETFLAHGVENWSKPEFEQEIRLPGHTYVLINPRLSSEAAWTMIQNIWHQIANLGQWFTFVQVDPKGELSDDWDVIKYGDPKKVGFGQYINYNPMASSPVPKTNPHKINQQEVIAFKKERIK